ncbi:MAG: 1-acyl-sn-glycerol-3-phosphate acyltransferase [Bacteroidetes bacterium]|nr:1-acyl-sn-glycerol-3-phosphate acyltransferase [Bacteroidota bacterium]
MKIIREIMGRIFATWGLIWFIVTMLLFFIPFLLFSYFLPDPKRNIRFIKMSRVWMKIYLTLVGCPLKVKGKENFKKGESYIVICNHNSFMDIPISSPAIPGGNKTIAKVELAKVPLFGLLYKTGSVLVDRKSDASRKESYIKMKETLNMGLHMCIYPEGTRNTGSEPLRPFHDGAFKLAVNSGKSIIPALIFYTRGILPSNKIFYFWPHHMEIHFLPPVEPLPDETHTQLKEKAFNLMKDYYIANNH